MSIVWNYKIELEDKKIFSKIEKERGIIIPDELKEVVMEGNAATPEKYKFTVGSTERVVGAVLSFNRKEKDADTVFTALEVIEDKNLLPFAIDPFGNYICIDLSKKEVIFRDHETGDVFSTGYNLKDFFDKLY